MESTDYQKINRKSWNDRVESHLQSEFYDMEGFRNGKNSLKGIELDLLGDVSNKSVLHLQCHFGQDTLSLARMGAKVTGVDISDESIAAAEKLTEALNLPARFICSDVYDLPGELKEEFDMVFTSYGTIGWLPDINKWAKVVSRFLKPGGEFVFAEFHPVVWMFDDDFKEVKYRYFNSGPIVETETGSYADKKSESISKTVSWNHGLAEVLDALVRNGLNIETIREFDYSPHNCFQHTVEYLPGKFRIKHLNDKIPMVYALKARKI